MKNIGKNFLLMAMMIAASGLAVAMRPTEKVAERYAPVELAKMVPIQFGEWREEPQNHALIIDPQQKEMIDRIYTQTLTRTYINSGGYRIMLSIAYGTDQTDTNQVHKPDVCYPAQGFVLKNRKNIQLDTEQGVIPATRIEASMGLRNEPVTYWITVADRVVSNGFEKKFTELSYGLKGQIPDGLLFRVSSIDTEVERAYAKQADFSRQLLVALTDEHRQRFIGKPTRDQK